MLLVMIKLALKRAICMANKLYLATRSIRGSLQGSSFFLVSVRNDCSSRVSLLSSELQRVKIEVLGTAATVEIEGATISDSSIRIDGEGGHLCIARGVIMRGVSIIINGKHCSISVGQASTVNGGRLVVSGCRNVITIGEDCMLSDQVEIWASDTHSIYDGDGTLLNSASPISIGDHVWVGCRAAILKGVRIGDGSVIGMGAVVTSDVPARSISVGHPNRTIKANVHWTRNESIPTVDG